MKKAVLFVSLLSIITVSDGFARGVWNDSTPCTYPEYTKDEPNIPEVPNDDEVVTVHPAIPSVNPNYIAQNKARASHYHHKSWWDKHGDEVIVGTAITAVFIGVAVYAFGMEQSQNDPTKVTIMKF